MTNNHFTIAATLLFLPTAAFADLQLLYGDSSSSQVTTPVEELYAGLPTTDGPHIVNIEDRPIELSALFTSLDFRREIPKPKIKSYSFSMPGKTSEPARNILDFIAQYEASPAGYNSVWAGNKTALPGPPTTMTICDVKDWQSIAALRQKSTAIGRYQMISETFARIAKKLDLNCDTLFEKEVQDQMAMSLLIEAGWTQFVGGHTSTAAFGHSLAGVWAAFPATSGKDKGKSRYWRIAGNKALVSLPNYLKTLSEIRSHHNRKERRVATGTH